MENTIDIETLRFPIGKFEKPAEITPAHIQKWIADIAVFPAQLLELCRDLTEEQLQWRYRPQGWTIQQVVHHCADSHMNSFIRFKLSLTEDTPTIKPYYEDRWAELPDAATAPISHSLLILEGLHARWTMLLSSLQADDFDKEFLHPEHGRRFSLAENIGVYAWHARHHFAHIQQALRYQGRFEQ